MNSIRDIWNDAKAGCPDAVLILEHEGTYHTFGEDAKAVKYAMGEVSKPTGEQLNAALEELTSRGTEVVFAEEKSEREKLLDRIEQAANETDTDPSDEQKEAENYRKGKFSMHGMRFAIENPKGSIRSGKDWEITMPAHYGYILKTESEADGDHVDCFIGDYPDSEVVFVVDQENAGGRFDEHKCMIGFVSEEDARETYKAAYTDGWRVGPITAMTMDAFRAWLEKGDTGHRIAEQISKYVKQKYAADPWSPYTGPQGGKGWINSQTGRVFYGPNKPGRDEPGEEVAAPPVAAGPPEPSMSDPIPLPPGTAKGLGATGAPGLPNFQEPPAEGDATQQWGSTESLASLYGRDGMSPQTAQRFNVSAAKLMGLEIPEGQKEQQQALAEEFLRHNAAQLSETMNAAESMGWKPRGKRLITNAGSAARWLVGQAEATGYERQGGGMTAELAGAVNHLQDSEQAIQAAPGLQAAVEAYASLTKLVGPLIALPLAIAYGYLNKGGTSAVAGANTHLDQLSERLGIRSPFVSTTRVEPKSEKPIKLRPEDFLPEKTAPIEPTVRKTTPEDIPAGTPKAPPRRTRRQVGAEIAGETRQENARLLQEEIDRIPESARADFTTQYKALLDDRSQTVSKIRGQRDELLANIAGTQGMGGMTRQIQRAEDPDQVKGFDLLVQLVENAPERYSDLMGVGELGQSAGEIQDRLFDVLKKPKGYFQPPQAHQVADELASEWLRQETAAEERTASQMDAEAETASFDPSSETFGEGPAVEEFDPQAEPFAKRSVRSAEHPTERSASAKSPIRNKLQHPANRTTERSTERSNTPDPYAQKFARDLSTGKLPNLSALPDPEVTIAEADRVLQNTDPSQYGLEASRK